MIKCGKCGGAIFLGEHVCVPRDKQPCQFCGQLYGFGEIHSCQPSGMIYCNMCKRVVPMRHLCTAVVQNSEVPMKPKARNFVVIGEKDQSNPPSAQYFNTYQEAEDYAVKRARETDTGYDIYGLASRAFVRPQAPVINKVVPGDDDR